MIAVNASQKTKSDVALNLSQSTLQPWKLSSELKCSLYVVYTLISSFGISGNIAVCYILGIKKRRTRRFDILLISLAFADLLALISGSVTMIGDLAGDLNRWYFGSFLCKLLPSIAPVTLFVSSWTLVVISFDRYQYVEFSILTLLHHIYSLMCYVSILFFLLSREDNLTFKKFLIRSNEL